MLDPEDRRVREIVTKLAQRIDLCRNFSDILVINDPNMPTMAGVNAKTEELIINIGNGILTFEELSKCIQGIVAHEVGHTDKRLGVPSNWETFKEHRKAMKRRKLFDEKGIFWQNLVYDMEVHHAYNKRAFIKPKIKRELKKFLTMTRNKVFETDPSDLILSMEYPTTKEHMKVKKIIENRNWDIIKKISKLAKDKKLNQPSGKGQGKGKAPTKTLITEMIDEGEEDEEKDKKGKQKKQSKQQKEKKKQKPKPKPVRIKREIEKENQKNDLIERLQNLGLSVAEIDEVLQKRDVTSLISKIECLEKSFKDILPNLEAETSREKTKEKSKDRGHRINGYKRIQDFSDLTRNVEDMVTVGEHDVDEVRIPYKIDRKCKGNILIVRDTSGSVSSHPMDKIVRDLTVTLITIARKKQHKVGVVDFHSQVEPIYDKKRNILTSEYNVLLLDSMKFKLGYSTLLSKAIKFVNEEIIAKHPKIPLNVFIVSDSMVNYDEDEMKLKGKVNVAGLWVTESEDDDWLDRNFEKAIKDNKGRVYKLNRKNQKEMMTKLVRDFGD